ncbi:hypothetical protein, partial [Burkholderia ubonensis]|uniref:hypothetical protein n=1 Tax=Burkholderia ubonensis TaxID=101571 RepID=UPI00358E6F25
GGERRVDLVEPRRIAGAERALARDPLAFDAQAVDAPARVFDRLDARWHAERDALETIVGARAALLNDETPDASARADLQAKL